MPKKLPKILPSEKTKPCRCCTKKDPSKCEHKCAAWQDWFVNSWEDIRAKLAPIFLKEEDDGTK